jgi:hypothetical protein
MRNPWADKNFTGALRISAVNCGVVKQALVAVLGGFGFCLSIAAEQLSDVSFEELSRYRPEVFGTTDSLALLQGLPMLCFLDQQFLPVSGDLSPAPPAADEVFPTMFVSAARKQKVKAAFVDSKDMSKTIQPVERHPIYYSGEVGAFYGHASGKVHGDAFGSYLESTVGDDHVQITVGASYDEFNGRGPRRGW